MMGRRKYFWCFICFSVYFFSACQKDEDNHLDTSYNNGRTLLFYLGGANNLAAETDEKMEQLRSLWKDNNGKIVVFQAKKNVAPVLCLLEGDDNGEGVWKTLKTYALNSSTDASTFAQFITDAKQFAPAADYGLVVFSHASGWLPKNTISWEQSSTNTSVRRFVDINEGSIPVRILEPLTYSIMTEGSEEMEIQDFASAIPEHQFSFIVFEACYMSGIEVVYELKDKADYIFASGAEMLSPGLTWVYPDVMEDLFFEQPKTAMINVAQAYFKYWSEKTSLDERSATISVIETNKLRDLSAYISANKPVLSDIAALNGLQQYGRNNQVDYFFDFFQYFTVNLADSQTQTLEALLDQVVVYQEATPTFMPRFGGFTIQQHSGLTTYIVQSSKTMINQSYKNLSWYRDALMPL